MKSNESNDYKISSEYICPKCGGEVECLTHPTYPPQTHFRCLKCGAHKDIPDELPTQKIAPLDDF